MTITASLKQVADPPCDIEQLRRELLSALRLTALDWDVLLLARDAAPVVLSTQRERNLPLYERAGFVLKEDHQMGVRWDSRGFRTWFMLREP